MGIICLSCTVFVVVPHDCLPKLSSLARARELMPDLATVAIGVAYIQSEQRRICSYQSGCF